MKSLVIVATVLLIGVVMISPVTIAIVARSSDVRRQDKVAPEGTGVGTLFRLASW